jgi:hypothetical protein
MARTLPALDEARRPAAAIQSQSVIQQLGHGTRIAALTAHFLFRRIQVDRLKQFRKA